MNAVVVDVPRILVCEIINVNNAALDKGCGGEYIRTDDLCNGLYTFAKSDNSRRLKMLNGRWYCGGGAPCGYGYYLSGFYAVGEAAEYPIGLWTDSRNVMAVSTCTLWV